YDGNSQGGIEGGALTALAPDFDHAVLGVPGMNYSLLIQRSVDFDPFGALLDPSYPNEIERPLIISLLEVLWTRGDADGYAQHMTDNPYPDTPRHKVLLEMAFGDHQVTNWATEVEARTIGARLRAPAVFPGRSTSSRSTARPSWCGTSAPRGQSGVRYSAPTRRRSRTSPTAAGWIPTARRAPTWRTACRSRTSSR